MDYSSKKCFNCAYFNRYYIRGVKRFHDTKFGRCGEKGATVENTDSCEEFIRKRRRPRFSDSVQIALNNLLTDISAIRHIIEEDIKND